MSASSYLEVHEDPARYAGVLDRKAEGAHYTPGILASFVADQIVNRYVKDNSTSDTIRICDPASGDGELLSAIVGAFQEKGHSNLEVYAFELNDTALEKTRRRLAGLSPSNIHLRQADFLEVVATEYATNSSLFAETSGVEFDVIIANPPYVRTQVLGAGKAQEIASTLGLSGRVDLYHAFLHGISRILRPGGICGVIVSNRFMTTKGGTSIRQDLLRQFQPLHIFDFGDTKLFSAAVLPAVLLMERSQPSQPSNESKFSSIYSSKETGSAHSTKNAITALGHDGLVVTESQERFNVRHGSLDTGEQAGGVWRLRNDEGDSWLETVNRKTWNTFGGIGSIRVGVKTTADKVFIRSDWEENGAERPELVKPLTTHHIAKRFRAGSPNKGILYPHVSRCGRRMAVPLEEYPLSAAYLEMHRSTLESRQYVIESGRKWYEIWVPQDPALWELPKLVFRDISEQPTFWIDLEGTIVNGDCYWLAVADTSKEPFLWLALAVANSTFIEAFYDHRFNNKLYSGRRRFITQYVEHFPLPDPALAESQELIRLARAIYATTQAAEREPLEVQLDDLVWKSFGFSGKE